MLCSFGQKTVVNFEPRLIGDNLKTKPFFRTGKFIHIDDVRFENDTNYFTLYIVNNSNERWSLMTVEGHELAGLDLTQTPTTGDTYSSLLRIEDTELVSCGNSYFNKNLGTNEYIMRQFAIPCYRCSNGDKINVRVDLANYTNAFDKPTAYFYSNIIEFYFDDYVFEQFNKSFWRSGKSLYLTVSPNHLNHYIGEHNIYAFDRRLVLDSGYKKYNITGFDVILLLKEGEVVSFLCERDRFSTTVADTMKRLRKSITHIIIDNIRAQNINSKTNAQLMSQVYTIASESSPLYLNLANKSYGITPKALKYLSDSVYVSRNSSTDYTVIGFELQISKKNSFDLFNIPVTIKDGRLPKEVFDLILEEKNATIVFKNIKIKNNSLGNITILPQLEITIDD